MRLRRAHTLVPLAVCLAAIAALLAVGLTRNIVYFRTVSEAVDARTTDGDDRIRLAGAVVPGSVVALDGEVAFDLTDGRSTVHVRHRGDPPELFDDGAPVVSEGNWHGTDFTSDRLMIKHGSEYAPPEVTVPPSARSDGAPAHSAGASR